MFKNKQKWQVKLAKVLQGRYLITDKINQHLMIGVIVLIGLGLFIQVPILRVLSLAALVIIYLRLFSKNISKRMAENRKYLTILTKVKAPFQLTVKKIKTRKEYKYFKCPACKQQIRAPRNRGKISVTCRSCQHKFEEQT